MGCATATGGRRRLTPLCAAALLLAGADAARALAVSGPDGAVAPGAPIVLRLDRAPTPADGALAIFIGSTDVSALFRDAGAELRFSGRELALAPGEYPLVVWQVQGRQWREIGRSMLVVRAADGAAPAGAARQALTPTLDVTFKAQVHERTRGSATPPARRTFEDLGARGGLAFDGTLGPITTKGGANVVGASFRQEALQFGNRADAARKLDLADYRVELGHGPGALTLGHIGWGNHPLLLNAYASRGLFGTLKLGERFDVSVNAMNGTSIVGFDNLLGLADTRHRIHGASIGVEADPARPGWLRGELTYVDASLRALGNFNRGEIPDAERSDGFGLRLLAAPFDGRLRADVALARNRYRPAEDPQLAAGLSLTPLATTRRSAWQGDLALDLVRNLALASHLPLTVTALVRREQVQPLYKVLGASLAADTALRRAGLSANAGPIQASWLRTRREDNLDDIASLLKTGTEGDTFTVSVVLAELLRVAPGAHGSGWPRVTLQWDDGWQRALNAPAFAISGLLPTHLPDQATETGSLGLAWSLGRHSLSYTASHARQDNRQPGRENADFLNGSHQLGVNLAWSETLALNLGAHRSRQYSHEKQLAGTTYGASVGIEWRFRDPWVASGNYAFTRGDDSRDLALARGHTAQTQLARRFTLPGPFGAPLAGQWFVRHSLQAARNVDRLLGLDAGGRHWAVDVGVTVSFF